MGTIRWQAYNKGEQQQKCMIYTYENAIMKPFMIHVFTYYTFICTHINFGPAQRLEQQIILDKNIVNGVFVSSLICVCFSSLFLLVDRPWF